jgi:RNA polymerase sigma-70 factor (ECF subfamily)
MDVEHAVREQETDGRGGRDLEGVLAAEIPRLLCLAERLCGNRPEAEDLVQDTLLRALRRYPDLGAPSGRRALLRTILVRRWTSRLRSWSRRREARLETAGNEAPSRLPGPADRAVSAEAVTRIRSAMASLPPHQRAALVLSVDEGLGVSEIAEVIGSTATRVKANLWFARKKLRERLADLMRE